MREIRSYEKAYSKVKNHIEKFADCVRNGFDDFKKVNEFKNTSLDLMVDLEIGTRSSFIHDCIKARLNEAFKNEDGITVGKWNQIFAVQFDDSLFVRVKKFKGRGNVSSYSTKQHRAFMKQAVIDGIPDEHTFIFAGYIPNKTWTELVGIYLACWSADGLEWFNKVGEYVVEQAKIVFTEPVQTTSKKRVRVKPSKDSDKKTGTDN